MEQTVQFLQRLVPRLTRAQPLMLYSEYMNALMDKAELQEPQRKNVFCVFTFYVGTCVLRAIGTSVKHYGETNENVIQKPIFSLSDFLKFGIITTCSTCTKGTNYRGTSLSSKKSTRPEREKEKFAVVRLRSS